MFTIKWIKSMGCEEVFPAIKVTTQSQHSTKNTVADIINCWQTEASCVLIDSGLVFVMNSDGRTVAKYDIGFPGQTGEKN